VLKVRLSVPCRECKRLAAHPANRIAARAIRQTERLEEEPVAMKIDSAAAIAWLAVQPRLQKSLGKVKVIRRWGVRPREEPAASREETLLCIGFVTPRKVHLPCDRKANGRGLLEEPGGGCLRLKEIVAMAFRLVSLARRGGTISIWEKAELRLEQLPRARITIEQTKEGGDWGVLEREINGRICITVNAKTQPSEKASVRKARGNRRGGGVIKEFGGGQHRRKAVGSVDARGSNTGCSKATGGFRKKRNQYKGKEGKAGVSAS